MPLIIIDGIDGTGKAVQSQLLADRLGVSGHMVKILDFPRYSEGSGQLAKQYLTGKFGSDPAKLDPYLISPLYMLDRIVSYLTDWRENYQRGDWLVSNRYVSSNIIHQGAKLLTQADRADFGQWLEKMEFDYLGLPKPDLVIILDLPLEISKLLRFNRSDRTDIHEADSSYLRASRLSALEAAHKFGWKVIHCADGDELRSQLDISDDIMAEVIAAIPSAVTSV